MSWGARKCEDVNEEIRSHNSKKGGQNVQWPKLIGPKDKQRSTNLHTKLKIEEMEHHQKPGLNSLLRKSEQFLFHMS